MKIKHKDLEKIKTNLLEYKWIYIISILIISLISYYIWYEYAYPCIYGHYEKQYQIIYITDSKGNMTPAGGYYTDIFICDCRDTLNKK